MKKLFLLFATLLGSVGVSAYDFEVNGIQYTITSYDNHEAMISGFDENNFDLESRYYYFNDSQQWKTLDKCLELSRQITDTNNRYWTITSVAANAFKDCSKIENIVLIPDIDGYSINNVPYRDYKFINIEESAFENCVYLQSVIFNPDCWNWNSNSNCISRIKMGYFSNNAFRGCTNLKTIELPLSSEGIGLGALADCPNLESISTIGEINWKNSYYYDSQRQEWITGYVSYYIPEGSNAIYYGIKGENDVFIPKKLVAGCKNTVFSDSITTITSCAFKGCTGLTNIPSLNKLTSIEEYAFYGCTGLINIESLPACKSIGDYAFQGCESLKAIGDLSACESISYYAFQNCTSLTTLCDLPACKYIYNNAFSGCTSLKTLGDLSVCTSIGYQAFCGCTSLTTLDDLPACTTIGWSAFQSCTSLTTLGNLSACTSIGESAFSGCKSLASFTLPKGVTTFYSSSISGCTGLETLKVETGNASYDSRNNCNAIIKSTTNELIAGCKNTIIPNTVTAIGAYAFRNLNNITSINLPSSVTTIGNSAFYYCTNLSSINIPSNISEIGNNVFDGCNSLMNITLGNSIPTASNSVLGGSVLVVFVPSDKLDAYKTAGGWSNYASRILPIGTQTVYDISVTASHNDSGIHSVIGETNLKYVTELTLTGSINSYDVMIMRDKMPNLRKLDLTNANIVANSYEYMDGYHTENNAFLYGMRPSGLTELKLPLSLKKIGNSAFYSGNSLKELVIPEGVEEIDKSAFYNCDLITSIPKSVVSIGESAFRDCDGLTELDFSNSQITTIGKTAFYGCRNIQTIDFSNSPISSIASEQYSDGGVFSGCDALSTLDFSNCANLTTIGALAFRNCASLSSVDMSHSNVGSIETKAFVGCTSLRTIDMSNSSIGTIGNLAFLNCSKLESVSFENSVINNIAKSAFSSLGYSYNKYYSNSETNIYWNYDNYHSQGPDSVYRLKSLQTINIKGAQINSIGEYAFYDCRLLDVDFSEATIGEILNYAFYNTSVKTLDLANSIIRKIGDRAFATSDTKKTTQLRSVDLSNSQINTIGERAFNNCDSLRTINLSNSELNIIGQYAFYGCDSLKDVNISVSKIETIGNSAFCACNSLKNVNLSNCQNLTTIENSAFCDCNKLEEIQIPGSVKTIGSYAFNCNGITDVYAKTIIPRTITINTFSNNTMKNGTLHVPALSYKNYYWATNWSQFATIVEDANPDYFFIDDDLTVESGKATGDAVDADINTVGGMVVEDDNQAFNEVSVENNGSTSGSFIPSNNTTINIINLNITVTANKWQFLSFPYRVKLTDVVAPGFYVFRRYDGQQRANTGGTGWASLAQETEYLEPGVGYIFQSSQSGTLGIRTENPDLSWGTGKTNPLSVYTTDNIQHASWNYVGNPMLCYYDIDDLHTTAPLTFWNGSSYVARRPGDDNYQMKPFEAFFLQKPNDVEALVYEKSGRMTYKQAQQHHNDKNNARAAQRSERYLVNLALVQGEETKDETRVVYNDKKSMVYEPDCDAAKFMSIDVNMPQLYSLQGSDRFAINERPAGEVQLGFTAAKAGELTISAGRMDIGVLLRDNLTGTTHDLNEGGYTFTTEAGTFNDRFTLVPESEATGISDAARLNDNGALDPRSLATNGTQEMINDKLYDLQGRRTTNAAQKGVRIVRKNHETRKVVR